MTEIAVYSPRKITPQNKRNLPTTHDPEKRTTYVQITLDEAEIAEAIRNYLKGQIAIAEDDELPVVLTAGRGENGHTAAVTITPLPVPIVSARQPTAMTQTFDAVSMQAIERTLGRAVVSEPGEDVPEADEEEEAVTAASLLPTAGNNNPNRLAQKAEKAVKEIHEAEEAVSELVTELVTEAAAVAKTTTKKSSLFKDIEPAAQIEAPAAPAAHAAAAPPTTGTTADAAPSEAAAVKKSKSIFDTLAK